MPSEEKGTTVAVTSKGQATIPKEFREKLSLGTPGKVRFVETEDGEVVLRPVERPSEIRGELAAEADDEQTATELLREERRRDDEKLKETAAESGQTE